MTMDSSGLIKRRSRNYTAGRMLSTEHTARIEFHPFARLVAWLSALLGLYAVYFYASAGLTLNHYDAKAHLVVARRIIDSITPGWEQIGAVWLPLPHLLNMLPVQIDFLYRTGASAIAISWLAQIVAVASIASTVLVLTASPAGAVL